MVEKDLLFSVVNVPPVVLLSLELQNLPLEPYFSYEYYPGPGVDASKKLY